MMEKGSREGVTYVLHDQTPKDKYCIIVIEFHLSHGSLGETYGSLNEMSVLALRRSRSDC